MIRDPQLAKAVYGDDYYRHLYHQDALIRSAVNMGDRLLSELRDALADQGAPPEAAHTVVARVVDAAFPPTMGSQQRLSMAPIAPLAARP